MLDNIIPIDLQSRNQFKDNYAVYFGQNFASSPFRILFLNNMTLGIFQWSYIIKIMFKDKSYNLTNLMEYPELNLTSLAGNEIETVLNFVVVDHFYQKVNLNFSR